MRLKAISMLLLAASFMVTAVADADAQNRRTRKAGNTVMGAAAGGLVFGPLGLLAGGLVGFAAGENIASGMGINRREHRRRKARHRH